MQPQDSGGIARRTLDVEDYIDIIRRHKAWIFGPLFAAVVVAVVVAFLWPDTYVSTAVIRVVPPEVPENFVPTNLNSDVLGRITALTQVMLSRATLTSIINREGLYKKELSRMPMDDVVEAMRLKDVKISPVQQSLNPGSTGKVHYPTFALSFAYSNRIIAKKVNDSLVASLLAENQQQTTSQTKGTTDFLKDQWDEAKKKLDGLEQKLSEFRAANTGRLPEEQQSNYQQLNAMQVQVLNVNTAMSRINQEKLIMEISCASSRTNIPR